MKRFSVIITIFCIALTIFGCSEKPSKPDKQSVAPKEVVYMEVKANDIMNDYIRDAGIAEKKYKNKNVHITGQLVKKGQFTNSSNFYAVIANKYAAGRNYSILVEYPVEKSEEINKLHYNDFVVAKGVCVGVIPQEEPTAISVQIYAGRNANENVNQPVNNSSPSPAVPVTVTQSSPTPSSQKIGTITGTEVRIRAAAGKTGQILGHFEKGENVTVLEVAEGWTKVKRSNGQVGWVSNDYCIVR